MDRGPKLVDTVEKLRDAPLVSEITAGNKLHALMPSVGKVLDPVLVDIGHVADRAGCKQRAHDRSAESAGSAGDDDRTIAIIHDCDLPMRRFRSCRMRHLLKGVAQLAFRDNDIKRALVGVAEILAVQIPAAPVL